MTPSLLIAIVLLAAALIGVDLYRRRSPPSQPAARSADAPPTLDDADRAELAALRHMLTEASDLLCRLTPEGRILYMSPACAPILGIAPEQMVGRTIFDFFHPDEVFRSRRSQEAVRERPGRYIATHRIRRADGSYVWLETVSRVLAGRCDKETAVEIVTVSRDISGRDVEQEALRNNESLYRRAFEEASIPTALTDSRSGQILRVNNAFCQMVGYSRAELREINAKEIIHPADLPLILEYVAAYLAGKNDMAVHTCRFLRKDGSTVLTEAIITLPWDDRGEPLDFICQFIPRPDADTTQPP